MEARIAYLSDAVLYADLRQRLEPHVQLVDLSAAGPDELGAALPELDAVLHYPLVPLDGAVIEQESRLRAIFAPGAGYDGIDIPAATKRGILVTNQAGCNDEAVAEHAIGLLLSVSKRIGEGDRLIRSGAPWHAGMLRNHEIAGKTLGIVGLGAIGRKLAAIAASGFGMRILAYDPLLDASPLDEVRLTDLEEVLRESDVVSVHVPLNEHTRGMIGQKELALLKPTAILVNTSRGYVVDQPALTEALVEGRIAGAGLDVLDDDRLPASHPLIGLDNVVLSPHCAGATHESLSSQAERQAAAVLAVLEGRVPETANLLNPEVVDAFTRRFGSA